MALKLGLFLYIDDAIKKIMAVMEDDNYWGPVNIGSSKEVTVNGRC